MTERVNPAARAGANRVLEIAAVCRPLDNQNPTDNPSDFQSEILAARHLARRFGIGLHHARVVCELASIGRAA